MSMEAIRWEANAFIGFMERQKNLYKRYWIWEVVWFAYSLVNVLSIGYLASGLAQTGAGGQQFDLRQAQLYLLIGSLLWGYLALVFFEVAFAIQWERWEGTIEYTFMAPIKRMTHLLGICTFSIVYGLIRTALVLAMVMWLFHLDTSHANLGTAALVLAVSTFPLLGLGILCSILPLLSPEKGAQMTVAVEGMLLLVSGVYYPISVMPAALQWVGFASPLTYALTGIRGAMLQNASVGSMLPTMALLAAMGVVAIPFGLWMFGRAEQRAKRLGLLKRSG